MSRTSKLAIAVLTTLFFAACGGGGGSSSTSTSSSSSTSSGSSSGSTTTWSGTKQLGVTGADTKGYSVATDASGNVYVAGYTSGGLDGNTLTSIEDVFVTKYDSDGNKPYTRQFGASDTNTTRSYSAATDASGNIYVTGYTSGGLDGNTRAGRLDFFVTKYDSDGNKRYTRQLGAAGATFTSGYSVTTDASGYVYVVGQTTGGLDGNTLTGTQDFFVIKYDSDGNKVYIRQFGVADADTRGHAVATDVSGNVYVVGSTTGGLDGNTLTGTQDFFVTKYDSDGNKRYTRQLGIAGEETWGLSVATDASGNVYVAGNTTGGLDGSTLAGTQDFFITKYDSDGDKLYTRQLGATGADTRGRSVTTDPSGNVYVAGSTTGGLNGNTLTGTRDFFVTKYDINGNKIYTRQLGAPRTETWGFAVATDASGNVYVAGYTTGELDGNTLTGLTDVFVTKYNRDGVKQ